MIEFQTRSEENGIRQLATLEEALKQADIDKTIWKISFTVSETKERIRLIRNRFSEWVYSPIN